MFCVTFSIDEMTVSFKGPHADKNRMTYKAKGGGLQTYAIFQKEERYQIFMYNDPLPKIYLAKIMLPLHARTMAYFDTVGGKCHQCAMDNIYNSAVTFKGR